MDQAEADRLHEFRTRVSRDGGLGMTRGAWREYHRLEAIAKVEEPPKAKHPMSELTDDEFECALIVEL